MQKQTQNLVLMLVIGVLMGTSAVMLWNSRGDEREDVGSDSSTPPGGSAENTLLSVGTPPSIASPLLSFPLPPSVPANTRVGLSVLDQSAGKMVVVSDLSVVGKKWVAVYDDHEGKPGWILGASRVHEGDKETSVELIRPEGTIPGAIYYAAILNDDGDGEFNRLTDLPPLSPDKVTIVKFMTK